jgi:hypothetical protein
MRPSPLAKPLCHCIKKVRNTVKLRSTKRGTTQKTKRNIKKEKEKAAIAICVTSVLQTKGKTLKRFKCDKKPYLLTQKLKM